MRGTKCSAIRPRGRGFFPPWGFLLTSGFGAMTQRGADKHGHPGAPEPRGGGGVRGPAVIAALPRAAG